MPLVISRVFGTPAPFLDLPMYALYFSAVLEKKSVKDLKARIQEFIKMDLNHRQVKFSS